MEKLEKILGRSGKMIGGSKSLYRDEHDEELVVFNANVCTKEDGKIWHGDLNVTLEESKIKKLARELGKRIYVLYESDGRFENEKKPLLKEAVYSTDGADSEFDTEYYAREKG